MTPGAGRAGAFAKGAGLEERGWEAALSSLPDSAFFEVVRHYLGPLSTPFHRPDLIERLSAFMERPETAERAASYLDAEDALLLSCVLIHDSPDEAELGRILPDMPGWRPLALRERLFNLEERLLIRRMPGGEGSRGAGSRRGEGRGGMPGNAAAAKVSEATGSRGADSRGADSRGAAPPAGETGAGELRTGEPEEAGRTEGAGAWVKSGTPGKRGGDILVLTPLGDRLCRMGYVGPGMIIGAPGGAGAETPGGETPGAETPGGESEGDGGAPGGAGAPFGGGRPENTARLNDGVLNAVLAFLNESVPLFLKDGGMRKKSMELIRQRFPAFFLDGNGPARVLLAGKMLIAAGLAERKGPCLQPVLKNWRALEALSREERRTFLIARAAAGMSLQPESAGEIIRTLLECLPEGRACKVETLLLLTRLLAGRACALSERTARRIITNLILLGELSAGTDGSAALPPGLRLPENTPPADGPALTITPAGDIRCRPEFPLICDFALAAEPVRADILSTFRFSRNHFLSALEAGIAADAFFTILETRSGRPLPQNLRTLASEWENEHRSLRLSIGVVLEITGPRRELISETGILDPYTLSRPAPGLWILNPHEERAWRDALARIGIERLPPLPAGLPAPPRRTSEHPEGIPRLAAARREPRLAGANWNVQSLEDPRTSLAALAAHPAADALSDSERREFIRRLERRTILSPQQIRRGAWRDETAEARGLDYPGKLRLIEAALDSRNQYIQITAAAGSDMTDRILLPLGIRRSEGEHILTGFTIPDETPFEYKVRKIGFMKRFRISLF